MNFSCIKNSCELPCELHQAQERTYHLKRAKAAQASGVKLIQIYDWDSKETVFSLLAGHLEKGWQHHSARKLEMKVISQGEVNAF